MKYIILISLLLISFFLYACGSDGSKNKTSSISNKTSAKDPIATESKNIDKVKAKDIVSSDDAEEQTDPMTKEQLAKARSIIKEVGDVSDLDAKKIFKHQCTSCHGRKGNLGINGAKKLSKSKIDLESAVAQVYFGKGLMLSYKQILSNKEIVAVAKYAETLRR